MAGEQLLVEDEGDLRSMLCAALRYNGFEISAAGSGREALSAIAEDRLDLVVLDIVMPDIDGFEVCRRLRADNDHTPVRSKPTTAQRRLRSPHDLRRRQPCHRHLRREPRPRRDPAGSLTQLSPQPKWPADLNERAPR